MKIALTYLKVVATFLVLLTAFQSCKVYQKQSISISEAITSEQKVRIIYVNEEIYDFRRLILNEEMVFGVTKIHSKTAKKLDTCIVNCSFDGKIVKIKLQRAKIRAVFPLHKN